MQGLIFALAYCAISLLLAEGVTHVLISQELLRPDHYRVAHSLVMLVMFASYVVISLRHRE